MEELAPHLCITAAYGNMLPQRFLEIPAHGTLNIHPSLLPRYRGAAPVNRCLEAGDTTTGVSLAYTVLACDAGPVLAQQTLHLTGNEQAPELLEALFRKGTNLLLEKLPSVLSGSAEAEAVPQDEAAATRARKMSKAEARLDFAASARELHNKVRAFAGWPGTVARVRVWRDGEAETSTMDLKILRSAVADSGAPSGSDTAEPPPECCKGLLEVIVKGGALCFPCRDGTVLLAFQVQAPCSRACTALAYSNSLTCKRLFIDDAI
jgi:methionyl-tRNA formyltransferase